MEFLEAVQPRRATKFQVYVISVTTLPTLLYRRLRGDAIETYKYLHGQYRTN